MITRALGAGLSRPVADQWLIPALVGDRIVLSSDGLGKEVVSAISTLNTAKGVEAGLSVVFLAIYLDRLTGSRARPGDQRTSLRAWLRSRRGAAARAC